MQCFCSSLVPEKGDDETLVSKCNTLGFEKIRNIGTELMCTYRRSLFLPPSLLFLWPPLFFRQGILIAVLI